MSRQTIIQSLVQLGLLAALSCQPSRSSVNPESLFDNQKVIWDCHHKDEWSSQKIAARLIGRWQWRYVSSELSSSTTRNAGLEINFQPDGTLTVWEKGIVSQSARWTVVPTDNIWGLSVQPFVSQLHGRILFCDQTVEFNDSYIDGSDNYFVHH